MEQTYPNDRPDYIMVPNSIHQGLQNYDTNPFSASVAVRPTIKAVALPVGAQEPQGRQTPPHLRLDHKIGARNDGLYIGQQKRLVFRSQGHILGVLLTILLPPL